MIRSGTPSACEIDIMDCRPGAPRKKRALPPATLNDAFGVSRLVLVCPATMPGRVHAHARLGNGLRSNFSHRQFPRFQPSAKLGTGDRVLVTVFRSPPSRCKSRACGRGKIARLFEPLQSCPN